MGTLYNQSARSYHEIDFDRHVKSDCEEIQRIADETGMSVADVIEVYKASMQSRLINCYVDNNDRRDEQLAGFGELFKSLNEKLDDLIEVLRAISENEDD